MKGKDMDEHKQRKLFGRRLYGSHTRDSTTPLVYVQCVIDKCRYIEISMYGTRCARKHLIVFSSGDFRAQIVYKLLATRSVHLQLVIGWRKIASRYTAD